MKPFDVLEQALQLLKNDTDGRQSSVMFPDTLTDARVNEKVCEILVAHVPASDLNVLGKCGQSWTKALKLAKKGGFDEAQQIFSAISEVIQGADIAQETRLLCESFSRGAAAFVDYKMKRWDAARQRISRALECDDALERNFGYRILHLHRLTLVENLSRVERKAGNAQRAMSLGGDLLVYLAGGSDQVNLQGAWGWQQLSLPVGNIRFRFASVSGDIAQYLACLELEEAASLFAKSSDFLHKPFVPEYADADAVRWFEGKNALLMGNKSQFLIHGEAILSKPPSQTRNPKLWCAALLDVMALCESRSDCWDAGFVGIVSLFDKYRFWTTPVKAYFSNKNVPAVPQN